MKYLNESYHARILGKPPKPVSESDKADAKKVLSYHFGLDFDADPTIVVELPLPDWVGSLDEEIAEAVIPYEEMFDRISVLTQTADRSSPVPADWNPPPGWHVWYQNRWLPIAPPSDRTMVYDIETVLVNNQWLPTCAVALTGKGLAVWVTDFTDMPTVIPLGVNNDIIGWNIGYDRQYSSSDYTIKDNPNRYVDLMSLWVVCGGMSNQQTAAWKAQKKAGGQAEWIDDTCTNSLAEVYQHFFGKNIDKGVRDNIVKDGYSWVISNMPSVLRYCYEDVIHTAELLSPLLARWKLRRPSPVSRAGLAIMGSCKLPLSAQRYPEFYTRVEPRKVALEAATSAKLLEYAKAYADRADLDKLTPQQRCLDWTIATVGINKGKPAWYRSLLAAAKKGALTIDTRVSTLILGLSYQGSPVLWKWDDDDLDKKGHPKGGWYTDAHGYLPHPKERGAKLTSMFVKDYSLLYENGFIMGADGTNEMIASKISLLNWISIRKRVAEIKTERIDGYPLCIPPIVPCGTVTGRSKDGGGSVWLAAPNPRPSRVGTELKSMVEAPAGYKIVGADVASEEAWLAGLYGDSLLGFCGATPLGLSNVVGTKAAKNDIHSLSSGPVNGDRSVAKKLVYAGLYGQGLKGCKQYLLEVNPTWDEAEATRVARQFLTGFKGNKDYRLGYHGGLASEAFNAMESLADERQPKTPLTQAWMSSSLAGNSDFKPTRVNWMCQASGVDFRDMLLVLIESFARKAKIPIALCIAIHDEVRYLVKEGYELQACYILQLAHLYTRFAFIRAFNLDTLPAGVAWFPEVDVDFVLRKDPYDPQITPTQAALALGKCVTPSDLLPAVEDRWLR